jgi:catechol 2,3-dioxygenase-like lactoylglutathione lyase family enzyme
MVGEFLEFSVATRPLAASFEFYRALGFSSLPAGDTLPDPYLALFDGSIVIGLHERDQDGTWLTFVRPGLRDYVRALRRTGVELHYAHLAEDEFHRLGFHDPSGQGVALLEARTFAPGVKDPSAVPPCGSFVEYCLPVAELGVSGGYWRSLGFTPIASGEAPHRWLRLEGHGLAIGLHEAHLRPALRYRAAQLSARLDYLRAKGVDVRMGCPLAAPGQLAATLSAPDGLCFYLLEDEETKQR